MIQGYFFASKTRNELSKSGYFRMCTMVTHVPVTQLHLMA